MRFSSFARRRPHGQASSGFATFSTKPASLRIAASMLGLAMVAGLGVASPASAAPSAETSAAPSTVAQPALAAAATLSCNSGQVYTINGGGTIRQVTTSSGTEATVGSFAKGNSAELNGLALSADGLYAYAIPTTSNNSQNMTVYRYSATDGTTSTFAGAQNVAEGGTFVMGGINPATGFYYYGRVLNAKLELYAFNTRTATSVGLVGSVPISNDSGPGGGTARGNGDLVFSADGSMYFVASSNTTQSDSNVVMRLNATIPTVKGTANLTASLVTTLNIKNAQRQFNGIAFEGGYLYLDTFAGHLYKVDASSGSLVGTDAITSTLSSPVDMASCQYNNSLVVQKNIVGRAASTDQFTMKATVKNELIGAAGTTTGTALGLQENGGSYASSIPSSGSSITISETGVSGTNLAQYASSWRCTDQGGKEVARSSDGDDHATSGTFTFPAQSGSGVNITCIFTNKPLTATVTVVKNWVGSIAGDSASFTANAVTGTSTAPSNNTVLTATFAQQTQVNVSEVLGANNKGKYTTVLQCLDSSKSTVAVGTLTGAFTLGAKNVVCTYTNTNTAASIVVAKKWIVDGIAYDNGEQPTGISAELTLTGPGTSGATEQKWGTERGGYVTGNAVTIAESTTIVPQLACRLTGSSISATTGSTTSGTIPFAAVLAPGLNSYTVTNTVECTTALTLLKFIDSRNGGKLLPGDFTLSAAPKTGTAVSVNGATTVTALNTKSVTAGTTYTLSESSEHNIAYLQLSLQRYTGTLNADGTLKDPNAWEDTAADISIATGHHEIYRFVNASVPAFTLPLTGGTGSVPYTLIGGGLLLLALLTGVWIAYRRIRSNRS